MLEKVNLEKRLIKRRNQRVSPSEILEEVQQIFLKVEEEREQISLRLATPSPPTENDFIVEQLPSEKIVHLNDIRSLCIDYRLRFVDVHFFKGTLPQEAITKIRALEKDHDITLEGLKIMAPAKRLKLENADDPLLFAPMGNGYYYLIHKWGNDLHPLRKALMWPYKNFENLVFTVFVLSILLTSITPMGAFTKGEPSTTEYVLLFLFMFKAVGGIVLFYGFAKGKNFNSAIWDSKYYNG